jgi:alkylated DNA repair protein alkB family protein 6
MPALDFKTLLQQERARKRHEQEQQQKEEVASEEEDDDDEEYKVPANFAARVDAMLGAVVASNVSPAVPLPEEGQDVDIMAVAAAKIVEESQQAKHCLHARLEPEYLGTAMAERNLARHALVGPPHGIFYLPEYVSRELEEKVMEIAHTMPAKQWVTLRGRRLQCFGGKPTEDVASFKPQVLPPWVKQLCQTLTLAGVFGLEETPDHVLLNEYQPGQGIMAHTDGPFFRSRVAILSLGGPSIFRFKRRLATAEIEGGKEDEQQRPVGTVVLQPRSLIVFEGDAYHGHMHEILAVEEEVVGGEEGTTPVLNLATAGEGLKVGDVVRRALRVSLTFRKVNKPEEERCEARLSSKKM